MIRKTIIFGLSGFLMIFWLLQTAGLRGVECLSEIYKKPVTCIGNADFELLLWGVTVILIGWDLLIKKQFGVFINSWKHIWIMIPFLVLALISTGWSIAPLVSLERSIILLAATISAVYISSQMEINGWADLLAVFFAFIIIVSYLLIFILPEVGRMLFKPYNGAWCGVFWHRNYLGSFMALASTVYLFRIFFMANGEKRQYLNNGLWMVASVGLVFGSRSAAGILTLLLLFSLITLIFIWTKIRTYLKVRHYVIFGLSVVALSIIVFTNLDFVFGLVNRNTSLTGRIPLWEYLYQQYISNRLVFGHGYGAFWTFEQVRVGVKSYLSWGYPVLIGDNGLIDIVLHLGLLGVLFIVSIISYAFFITGKFALTERNGMAFFPLICIVFIVMSNISLSMIVELEYFVWALLIFSFINCANGATFRFSLIKNGKQT
jgi:exopolysaccharide production protein ExoQ